MPNGEVVEAGSWKELKTNHDLACKTLELFYL